MNFSRILRKIGGFLAIIGHFLDDILVLLGLAVVIRMNFHVSWMLGWYSLGVVLIGLGILIGKFSGKRGWK